MSPESQAMLDHNLEKFNMNFDITHVTKVVEKELCSSYLLVPVPKTQEDVDNVMNIDGYLKQYHNQLIFFV